MEVTRYPEYDDYVWIKATYDFDGSFKGSDVGKQYNKFVYEYTEELYGKVSDIFDAY
jgi:hypothetical protein